MGHLTEWANEKLDVKLKLLDMHWCGKEVWLKLNGEDFYYLKQEFKMLCLAYLIKQEKN